MEKLTTGIRATIQLGGIALLTFLVFYDSAVFRHPVMLVLVPLFPLALVFVAAPAAKTVFRESLSLRASFTWWEGLWLLLFLSGLVFRMRAVQEIDQSALDVWALYRVGLVLIVGLVLCARLVSQRTNWLGALFSGSVGVLAIYSLLSVVSTVWSVRPPWTFYKSVEYLVDLATISAVIASIRSVREYRQFANWTWMLLGLLVVSAWIGAIIDPADGLLSGEKFGPLTVRLEGVMPSVDADTIGEICAILALVALNRMLNDPEAKHNRGWYGGLLSVALGLAIMFLVTRRFVLTAALGGVSAIGAAIALIFTNFGRTFSDYLIRGQSAQELQGLSGRLDIWQASFEAFFRRPWIGYGGFAGSRFVVLPGIASQGYASSALSSYIDSLLDLGVWGPLLLLVALAGAAWFLFRVTIGRRAGSSNHAQAVEMCVVLSVIIVRSFVTSNIMGHLSLAFLTVIGFVEVARREEVGLRRRMPARAA
jgi:hypothetical protein